MKKKNKYAFDNLFEKKDEWKLKGNWVLVTRNKLMKIKQHITKTTFLLIISHSLNFALPTAVYTKSSSKCELDNSYHENSFYDIVTPKMVYFLFCYESLP